MSNHEKIQSPRPADKKLLEEQASGNHHHSGVSHPPIQHGTKDAKHDPEPLKSAHADRAEKTGDSKY